MKLLLATSIAVLLSCPILGYAQSSQDEISGAVTNQTQMAPDFNRRRDWPGRGHGPGNRSGVWVLQGQCVPNVNCYAYVGAIMGQPCFPIGQFGSGYDGRGNYFNLYCD